ncbi:MAG TPA: ATP-dependent endonuclease, partial [Succinivibrionaceae bacterium]|nr:ATP-dependent endonuclease [Succinivibrionaceae bacterium]
FETVFLRCAGIRGPLRKGTTSDRVIELAIRIKTKPGLAIEVIEEMRRRGAKGVPPVILDMIYKLRALSRGDFL